LVYLQPALQAGLIAMTKPDTPRAVDQKYFLTEKGQKNVAPGEKMKIFLSHIRRCKILQKADLTRRREGAEGGIT